MASPAPSPPSLASAKLFSGPLGSFASPTQSPKSPSQSPQIHKSDLATTSFADCSDYLYSQFSSPACLLNSAFSFLTAIWLFTFSDIKTIIAPSFAFGTFTSLVAASFGIDPAPTWVEVLHRTPLMVLWSWINLLPFAIDNQRRPGSIAEDSLNKPWRTLPSKRMTPEQAYNLMLVLYPIAVLVSLKIGGLRQCLGLIILGTWYNGGKGADQNCIVRNFINACGFICHISAPLEVALGGGEMSINQDMTNWLVVIWMIVLTTVHTQDMYDQAGDKAMGRNSVPIVIGDVPARWTIAIPMAFWSVFCPWYWSTSLNMSAVFVLLGVTIAVRSLTLRTVSQDKTTFRLWNLWMVCLYAIPASRTLFP